MPRFTVGARVRVADDKTTDRVGTVIEVLPGTQRNGDYDDYRVEFYRWHSRNSVRPATFTGCFWHNSSRLKSSVRMRSERNERQ
jgi:hypothetical protein